MADKMEASREAFEAWLESDEGHAARHEDAETLALKAWQAAEARGMERAALIVDAKAAEWSSPNGIVASFSRYIAVAIRDAIRGIAEGGSET